MQISEHTPQAELESLYTAVTQREMLRSTPLNLRMFLRYAVLFILFPGMVAGFRAGLALMLLCCVALGGLLLNGMQEQAVIVVQVWLAAGVCVWLWVSWRTVRSALALRRLRRLPRPADSAYTPDSAPAERRLRWHRDTQGGAWIAELKYAQPQSGICAILLQVKGAGRGRLITPEHRGVCMVQSSARGADIQSLLLYRLEGGRHSLRWVFVPAGSGASAPPEGSAIILSRPSA